MHEIHALDTLLPESSEATFCESGNRLDHAAERQLVRALLEQPDEEFCSWLKQYPYRPRSIQLEEHESLISSVIEIYKEQYGVTEPELRFLEAAVRSEKQPIDLETLNQLKDKRLVFETDTGSIVPIFWVETVGPIPLDRRPKLYEALFDKELLKNVTIDALEQEKYLIIEFFDDRGDHRRVLSVSGNAIRPFVLKYTHLHRRDIEDQFMTAKEVISWHDELAARKRAYDCLVERDPTELIPPVVRPANWVKVGETEIFAEELIDGPTRGDLITYLCEVRGFTEQSVRHCLARLEGLGLGKIFIATEERGKGTVLEDLTERNVKYQCIPNAGFIARYFDFERVNEHLGWSAPMTYTRNNQLQYLNSNSFIFGWVEGMGVSAGHNFVRIMSSVQDQLGFLWRMLRGALAHGNSQSQFLDAGVGAGVSRDDFLPTFIYRALANDWDLEIPYDAQEATSKLLRFSDARNELKITFATRLGEIFSSLASVEKGSKCRTLEGLIGELVNSELYREQLHYGGWYTNVRPSFRMVDGVEDDSL